LIQIQRAVRNDGNHLQAVACNHIDPRVAGQFGAVKLQAAPVGFQVAFLGLITSQLDKELARLIPAGDQGNGRQHQ